MIAILVLKAIYSNIGMVCLAPISCRLGNIISLYFQVVLITELLLY